MRRRVIANYSLTDHIMDHAGLTRVCWSIVPGYFSTSTETQFVRSPHYGAEPHRISGRSRAGAMVPAKDGSKQILFQPDLTCLCGSDLPFFSAQRGAAEIRWLGTRCTR